MSIYKQGDTVQLVNRDTESMNSAWTDYMEKKFGGKIYVISSLLNEGAYPLFTFEGDEGYGFDYNTCIHEVIRAYREPNLIEVGDTVRLTKKRPDFWNNSGLMDEFLGAEMIIESIENSGTGGNTRVEFTNKSSKGWLFNKKDIESIVLTSKKSLLEYTLRGEKNERERLDCLKTPAIAAIDIFGEDRVWVKEKGPLEIEIFIKFPYIKITNSREEEAEIRGLMVQIPVRILNAGESGLYRLSLSIKGSRYIYSPIECKTGYNHSHLPSGRRTFTDFCLGASNFKIAMETLSLHPCEENWYLFLLSIERYLSWESIEGGPYSNISYLKESKQYSEATIMRDSSEHLLGYIPERLWDIESNYPLSLSMSDNVYSLMCSNPVIGKKIYSGTMDNFNKEEAERNLNGIWQLKGMPWKDDFIPISIYTTEKKLKEGENDITPDMAVFVTSWLSKEFKNFRERKIIQYAKQRNFSESIGRLEERAEA